MYLVPVRIYDYGGTKKEEKREEDKEVISEKKAELLVNSLLLYSAYLYLIFQLLFVMYCVVCTSKHRKQHKRKLATESNNEQRNVSHKMAIVCLTAATRESGKWLPAQLIIETYLMKDRAERQIDSAWLAIATNSLGVCFVKSFFAFNRLT